MEKDISQHIQHRVLAAINDKIPLNIIGNHTKAFYGGSRKGQDLHVSAHRGIIYYEPTELVLTARCGTPLAEIESALAGHRQMLAFEPPYFSADATLGGTIASGLSGPIRPYSGSARDSVLGVKIINGQGKILKFGGQVMKNVAGFDVSRLMVGAMGTLGILLEVSLKVLPMPESELTVAMQCDTTEALIRMSKLSKQNLPISGMCYDGHTLRIRLYGAETATAAAAKQIGGDSIALGEARAFWLDLREQKLEFFEDDQPLWRLSLPAAAPQPELNGSWLIDWGGALRWLKADEPAENIMPKAQALDGHASRFRSLQGGLFQPLPPALAKLHRNIKTAFDPYGIFNPGRLYPDW